MNRAMSQLGIVHLVRRKLKLKASIYLTYRKTAPIGTHEVYSAFPTKEDYGYGVQNESTGDTAPRKSPVQRRPDNLRAEATGLLREALGQAGPADPASQVTPAADNRYQQAFLAGRTSDVLHCNCLCWVCVLQNNNIHHVIPHHLNFNNSGYQTLAGA